MLGFVLEILLAGAQMGGSKKRVAPLWPRTEVRQLNLLERIELQSTCEAVALAEGLSLDKRGSSVQLAKRTFFAEIVHTISADTDGNVRLASSYSPRAAARLLEIAYLVAGLLVLYLAVPWFASLAAPLLCLLLALVATSLTFVVGTKFRQWGFRSEVNRIAGAMEAKSRSEVGPYRIAMPVRVETVPVRSDEFMEEAEASAEQPAERLSVRGEK